MIKSTPKLLILLLCVFTFTSCAKDSIEEEIEAIEYVAEKSAVYSYSQLEEEVLQELNSYRIEKGLKELVPIAEASVQGKSHNIYMMSKGKISHDNFANRYHALVTTVKAKAVSENIAYGYRTAQAAVDAWIKSDSHRKNLEGEHTHFGLSVTQDEDGKNYFTNIFLRK